MTTLTTAFLELILKASRYDGVTVTLNELLEKMNLSESGLILENIGRAQETLAELKLEITPPLSTGGFENERVMRSIDKRRYDKSFVENEIRNIESHSLEFKSSIIFDHNKANANPGISFRDCKSEEVIHSFIKTIAAFFNTNGGILYIGVKDDGGCVGLEADCLALGLPSFDPDKWQLALRDYVKSRFKEGNSINDYLEINMIDMGGVFIARLSVPRRKRLTFVFDKDKKKCLYRRQGNRTIIVEIDEVEEFLEIRNSLQ